MERGFFEDLTLAKLGIIVLVIGGFTVIPWVGDDYVLQVAFSMVMWIGLATSWNILGGFSGYVSFGHLTFFAVGGFTVGLIQSNFGFGRTFGLEFLLLLLLAGLVSLIIAAILAYPLLSLKGGYFAIAMLGVQVTVYQMFATFDILGGGIGVPATLNADVLPPMVILYYLMTFIAIITVFSAALIRRSSFGLGLLAIRENENAAQSLAIPVVRYKIQAFLVSAFFPGIIGGIFACNLSFIVADTMFDIAKMVDMIVYVVVGGLGTIAGPIVGPIVMVFIRYVVLGGVGIYHVFFTGFVIVFIMIVYPGGIVGYVRSLREGENHLLSRFSSYL